LNAHRLLDSNMTRGDLYHSPEIGLNACLWASKAFVVELYLKGAYHPDVSQRRQFTASLQAARTLHQRWWWWWCWDGFWGECRGEGACDGLRLGEMECDVEGRCDNTGLGKESLRRCIIRSWKAGPESMSQSLLRRQVHWFLGQVLMAWHGIMNVHKRALAIL